MGAGWYVALEREIPGVGGILPNNGRALLFAQLHLEEMARAAELPPLKAFFSSDPSAISSYLHEQGIEADSDNLPDEEWFDAAEALPTVRCLLDALHNPPRGLMQIEKVLQDLQTIESVLSAAERNEVRFHIATGLPDLKELDGKWSSE